MYLLGYDIGSSSVKASLVDAQSGLCVASDFFPKQEMEIIAVKSGWAEQNPEQWWENLKLATESVLKQSNIDASDIKAIGISYQMHGLVVVDKNQKVLRPAIIGATVVQYLMEKKHLKLSGKSTAFLIY